MSKIDKIGISEMNELATSFTRFGWHSQMITNLAQNKQNILCSLPDIFSGKMDVVAHDRQINLLETPKVPALTSLDTNTIGPLQGSGIQWWNVTGSELDVRFNQIPVTLSHCSNLLRNGTGLSLLRFHDENSKALTAHFLDFWLKNQNLYPKHWRNPELSVCFLGTIYTFRGVQVARFAHWNENEKLVSGIVKLSKTQQLDQSHVVPILDF